MFVIYFEDDTITEERVDFFGDFQEVCPGCGCESGEGLTETCDEESGCGYWRKLQGELDNE